MAYVVAFPWMIPCDWRTQLNYFVGNCLVVGSGTLVVVVAAAFVVALQPVVVVVASVGCYTFRHLLLQHDCTCLDSVVAGNHHLLCRPSSWTAVEAVVACRIAEDFDFASCSVVVGTVVVACYAVAVVGFELEIVVVDCTAVGSYHYCYTVEAVASSFCY